MEIELKLEIPPEIAHISDRLSDLSPLMADFQAYRREAFMSQIASEIGPSGEELAPLSLRYEQWKSRKFPGRPKRVLTGKTVGSYRSTVVGNSLTEELRSPQAESMQRGTDRMPARPYFPESVTSADVAAFERLAWRYLLNL